MQLIENAKKDATYINLPSDNGAIVGTPTNLLAYYFDVISSHAISTQSQITDNYLENGTAVQDHIAHSPLQITLSGICGDVIYKSSDAEEDYIRQLNSTVAYTNLIEIKNKLNTLTTIMPALNNTMSNFINKAQSKANSIKRYVGIVRSFMNTNDPMDRYYGLNQNFLNVRLKEIYENLKWLKDNNIPLFVNTPWGDFEDMYILSLTLRQGDVNFSSDIEITLKQLRFANVEHTKVDENVMATYNAQAQADMQNNGKAKGRKSALATDIDAGRFGAFLTE